MSAWADFDLWSCRSGPDNTDIARSRHALVNAMLDRCLWVPALEVEQKRLKHGIFKLTYSE
jgi:hypothetical protein